MPGGYLYGWDYAAEDWVKMVCDADGKLIVDLSAHSGDEAAHHAKYTDAESRAAINDIFGSDGKADKIINLDNQELTEVSSLYFSGLQIGNAISRLYYNGANGNFYFWGRNAAGDYINIALRKYTGTGWEVLATDPVVDTKISTHKDIASAHHDKYTDVNAQAACKLYGDLFWSCPGNHFSTAYPDVDNITKSGLGYIQSNADGIYFSIGVSLPHGSIVTKVIVYGNAAAEAETWYLRRIKLVDKIWNELAIASINTEDTSIGYETIDNSLYSYYFVTTSLDTNDEIWGARITYNI